MVRENIYRDLEVFYEQIGACPSRNRTFNFFELVYVISGKGVYVVNENKIAFKSGDLFITSPKDTHEFDLEGICEFIVVQFTRTFICDYESKSINHLECLLYHASHLSGTLIQNKSDQGILERLMTIIQECINEDKVYQSDLLRQLINSVIVLAARNIAFNRPLNEQMSKEDRILNIISYIQEHIQYPGLLKIAVIANKFGISSTYLGAYFKKQCGESIQDFISKYRLRLIEHRLLFSAKRVSEIADEFGFIDESHINKFFKRHKGVTLSEFRKK
ncbi:AraC family transcriptional regulator [Myroides albus]|uniref:AraC family transcriptional regulator n=1 Tax=Myroides albus TaxID=2562892 RepID=UPI0021595DE4|nr:AraC family transcriptional regulator [Myroides albus]UVD79998.1 AraC family transcriptional regulator [Myroides albus]